MSSDGQRDTDAAAPLLASLPESSPPREREQEVDFTMREDESDGDDVDERRSESSQRRVSHSRSTNDEYAIRPTPAPMPCASPAVPPQQELDLSAVGVWRHTMRTIRSNPSLVLNSGPGRMVFLGCGLGVGLGVGAAWAIMCGGSIMRQLGMYTVAMCAFHLLEFTWTAIFHPNKLSAQSFLLNHSREYHLALLAGLVEFFLESLLFPRMKYPSSSASVCMWVGLLLVMAGQGVRTLAMLTAADNFTHIVAETKRENHRLITHGIYSICRHPSYAGWFWWSVGTQVLLCNPLCTCAYAVASFMFFRGRIQYEERAMRGFWGDQYAAYQKKVPTGVPFIRGYGEQ